MHTKAIKVLLGVVLATGIAYGTSFGITRYLHLKKAQWRVTENHMVVQMEQKDGVVYITKIILAPVGTAISDSSTKENNYLFPPEDNCAEKVP